MPKHCEECKENTYNNKTKTNEGVFAYGSYKSIYMCEDCYNTFKEQNTY